MEQRLAQSGGPDIAFLRPAYFMENHLFSIPTIKGMGINGTPTKADLPLPQIATERHRREGGGTARSHGVSAARHRSS
jgi:hypothetical protein